MHRSGHHCLLLLLISSYTRRHTWPVTSPASVSGSELELVLRKVRRLPLLRLLRCGCGRRGASRRRAAKGTPLLLHGRTKADEAGICGLSRGRGGRRCLYVMSTPLHRGARQKTLSATPSSDPHLRRHDVCRLLLRLAKERLGLWRRGRREHLGRRRSCRGKPRVECAR